MVVLQADRRQFGLIVDEIRDAEEIVVKPLDRRLKALKAFAGATIMGDGLVALILDVLGLAQRTGIVSEAGERATSAGSAEVHEASAEKQAFLVFAGPDDARMAIPLDALARLEEFPAARVEKGDAEGRAVRGGNSGACDRIAGPGCDSGRRGASASTAARMGAGRSARLIHDERTAVLHLLPGKSFVWDRVAGRARSVAATRTDRGAARAV